MRQSTCMKTNRLLPCSERQKGPGGVPDIQSSRGRHQRLLVRQRAERKNERRREERLSYPRIDDRSLLADPDPQAIIIVSGYLAKSRTASPVKILVFSPMAGRLSKPSCVLLLGQKKLRSDSQRISTANFAADRLGIPMKLAQWLGLSLILARGIFLASRPCLFLAIPCYPLLGPHAQHPKIRKAEPAPVPESPDSVRKSRHLPELLLLLLLVHLETRVLPKGTGFRSFEVK
ncbi:hypothetical protein TRV_01492 [Trichophyton verrucosum HKI 0517]|uniref:Uncharacterized protein n=1 Tax=Trichophyton verrucosum (strain HKI 0517) TaxID=663202 RepID=D4D335_TRIVH|nr:uncharacterized protein TRV_01492 [Trichophyton verrucosum HKI 0517]EFE43744.1 hypothetical protein TRV_01492 [Trichophyton verrucosum HKI 0517]